MSVTDDRNDPDLNTPEGPGLQNRKYLVLSDEERAKGFVRPVRTAYVHLTCGSVTVMGTALAETYARQPDFYGSTWCVACKDHFPVGANGEFVWDGDYDPTTGYYSSEKVGT